MKLSKFFNKRLKIPSKSLLLPLLWCWYCGHNICYRLIWYAHNIYTVNIYNINIYIICYNHFRVETRDPWSHVSSVMSFPETKCATPKNVESRNIPKQFIYGHCTILYTVYIEWFKTTHIPPPTSGQDRQIITNYSMCTCSPLFTICDSTCDFVRWVDPAPFWINYCT